MTSIELNQSVSSLSTGQCNLDQNELNTNNNSSILNDVHVMDDFTTSNLSNNIRRSLSSMNGPTFGNLLLGVRNDEHNNSDIENDSDIAHYSDLEEESIDKSNLHRYDLQSFIRLKSVSTNSQYENNLNSSNVDNNNNQISVNENQSGIEIIRDNGYDTDDEKILENDQPKNNNNVKNSKNYELSMKDINQDLLRIKSYSTSHQKNNLSITEIDNENNKVIKYDNHSDTESLNENNKNVLENPPNKLKKFSSNEYLKPEVPGTEVYSERKAPTTTDNDVVYYLATY